MSAGPQLQLALLWPWLLMATLQAGLGQKGLAAAAESERAAAQKAIIRVIPLKVEPIILEGEFANVAEVTPAEGKLLQLSLHVILERADDACLKTDRKIREVLEIEVFPEPLDRLELKYSPIDKAKQRSITSHSHV
ncbi:hypothetical protein Q9233_010542 [Columba guinea]|nr:hypothetical protein Q9233_010542 [Columba guinea]